MPQSFVSSGFHSHEYWIARSAKLKTRTKRIAYNPAYVHRSLDQRRRSRSKCLIALNGTNAVHCGRTVAFLNAIHFLIPN